MTDDAHDVGLTVLIYGIAHGLAVYGKAFILPSVDLIPALERSVKIVRFDTDEDITDDGLAGNNAAAVILPAAEALSSLRF